jgi:two-component system response regulator RegA
MSPTERPTLLLVDDDEVFRTRLARALGDRGYEVRTAGNFDQACALAAQDSPELAVVDLRMPGRSGLELVKELRALDATTRVVVLTGYGSIATAVEAIKLGAVHYLAKPADADDVIAAFDRNADRNAASGNGEKPEKPERLDIEAPSLARAEWEHIQRVLADCDGNVSDAARRLGLHRRSLQRKLQKDPPQR